MRVLSIKVPIRKKSGNLFNDPWGLSTLTKELSAAALIMQSSSKELSILVVDKV